MFLKGRTVRAGNQWEASLRYRAGFTPGPWRTDGSGIVADWPDCEGVQLAGMFATHWTGSNAQEKEFERRINGQTPHNARLIAAAPELLEACKLAKKLLEPEVTKEPDRTIFWKLVNAITKAEGK